MSIRPNKKIDRCPIIPWQNYFDMLFSPKGWCKPGISKRGFLAVAVIACLWARKLNKPSCIYVYFDETEVLFYRKHISESMLQQRASCSHSKSLLNGKCMYTDWEKERFTTKADLNSVVLRAIKFDMYI